MSPVVTFLVTSYNRVKRKNRKTLILQGFPALNLAGDERIELPPKVLETPIIPFDQSPMFCFCCNYTYKRNSCQGKINKICTKSTIKRRWRDLNPRTGCPAYRISSADPSATWVHLRMLSELFSSFRENLYYYIRYPKKGQSFLKLFFFVLLTNLPDYNMIMR